MVTMVLDFGDNRENVTQINIKQGQSQCQNYFKK